MKMKTALLRLTLAPVLMLALGFAACSEQGSPSDRLLGPEQASFGKGSNLRLLSVSPQPAVAEGNFGAAGGSLRAGYYSLVVPGGAVGRLTHFRMEVKSDGVVALTAHRTDGRGVTTDVGAAGFKKPLTLALYYGDFQLGGVSETSLKWVWVQSPGTLAPVISTVKTDTKHVLGQLNHFSDYAVGYPNAE